MQVSQGLTGQLGGNMRNGSLATRRVTAEPGGQGLTLGCVRESGSREMETESNSFEKSALQREEEIWGGALAGGVESRKC